MQIYISTKERQRTEEKGVTKHKSKLQNAY